MAQSFRKLDEPYDAWTVDDVPIVVFVLGVSVLGVALAGGLTLATVL